MNTMRRLFCIPLAALIATSVIGSVAHSQDASDGGWHYLIEPYVMFPNMKGEVGVGNLPPSPVDEGPEDIFENLQTGAMLYAEAHNGEWAISSDVLYMKLEADVPPSRLLNSGNVEVSQLGWELALLRRLSPLFELGVAATYNEIEAEVRLALNTLGGPVERSAGLTEDWIDPTLVARATIPLSDNWFLQGRGNIGGFDVGSELTWQAQVDVGYRVSDLLLLTLGYRVIDIDYDNGSGRDRFVYDMRIFGPVLRLGFNF
jgi:hypothetical protein